MDQKTKNPKNPKPKPLKDLIKKKQTPATNTL